MSQQIWFYTDLGVMPQLGRPNDALALILFFLTVPVFTFWITPLGNWLSRHDEFQADQYSVQQCSADALVRALVKLYDDNASTLTPDPIHSAFSDSHPPRHRANTAYKTCLVRDRKSVVTGTRATVSLNLRGPRTI